MLPTDSQTGSAPDSIAQEAANAKRRPWQRPVVQAVDLKDITASNTGSGTDFAGRRRMMSDRRLKRDIQLMGVTVAGIPVYVFRYRADEAWWLGTMAQDLLPGHARAVLADENGMLAVDYAMIDAPFGRI